MLKVISALLLATVILSPIAVSALLLNNPIMLYDLFKDYLEGKNTAAITINIEPKINGETASGTYLVVIHNLTAEKDLGFSQIVFLKFMKLPGKVSFKVWRIPLEILPNRTIVYDTYEFLVIVADLSKRGLGHSIVEVSTPKPVNTLNVKIELKNGRIHSSLNKGKQCYRLHAYTGGGIEPLYHELVEVKYETQKTRTNIQLHSIPGLKVGYFVEHNTNLYFESYTSDWYQDTCPPANQVDWSSNGKKKTPPASIPTSDKYLVSDGAKGKLRFSVKYRLEKWLVIYETGGATFCYYVLLPYNYAGGSGEIWKSVSCSQCGGSPPEYAYCYHVEAGQEERIDCGPGGNGAVEATTSLEFSFGYGPFTLTISWYKIVKEKPFYISYKSLRSGTLCWWHHNDNPASYRVHFTWD